MNKDNIIILADDRIGTYSQAIALAKYSGLKYKIIFLKYNFLKILPNFIFSRSLIRIKRQSKDDILKLNHPIKYIISAGRRSATIALFLKKYFIKINKIPPKIIQIMRPEINFKEFDYVIIPRHDKPKTNNNSNLIISNSSLANIEIDQSDKVFKTYQKDFLNYKKPITSLLIGGNTKKTKFHIFSAKKLIEKAIEYNNSKKGTLIILSSRRTPENIVEIINSYEKKHFIFYDYKSIINKNPYKNILLNTENFIITGDSISMITECCSLGKKVFIYDDNIISSKKHRFFQNFLIENNYAKIFDKNSINEKNFKPKILDETKKIAELIFNNLG